MKRFINTLLFACVLLFVACDKPRVIPDAVLGDIFHDAMLVNAYLNYNPSFKIDSMNIYEPIFARYGYTTEDVHYTINNFSRRKSIRLSDVAEYMIARLEGEFLSLNEQVARQDTINNVASRYAKRTVLSVKDVVVNSDADSSRLRFVVRDLEPGIYNVAGSYTLDSLDSEHNRRLYIYFENNDSTKITQLNGILQRHTKSTVNQDYAILPNSDRRNLVVDFFHYNSSNIKQRKTPRITIHDLTVTYTPPIEQSVEQLFNHQSQMRIFSDSMLYLNHVKE